MSDPPTNSPFTYTCGIVGQLLHSTAASDSVFFNLATSKTSVIELVEEFGFINNLSKLRSKERGVQRTLFKCVEQPQLVEQQ